MQKKCIIVVPIYRKRLNPLEKVSLEQLFRILGDYDIALVAPESLIFDYGTSARQAFVERFSDEYFRGTSGYSQMMMSREFYVRFSDYEYLLVYQLDAFVFSDRLNEFCDKEFDYIGAPISQWGWNSLGLYGDGIGVVGNGGFSLRKISSCIRVLYQKERVLWNRADIDVFLKDEDKFWGLCASISFLEFHAADRETAEDFSVEFDVADSYERVQSGKLPFGCHAWYNGEFNFWKRIIEEYGYSFSEVDADIYTQSGMSNRIFRDYRNQFLLSTYSKDLTTVNVPWDKERKLLIWGAGDVGKRCMALLERMDVSDYLVISKNLVKGLKTYEPTAEILAGKDRFIIIASTKFEEYMKKKLVALGLVENRDFMTAISFTTRIVQQLYPEQWNGNCLAWKGL